MVRKTKEEAEKTREALIDAAEQVFFNKGVGAASLEEIAQLAGVTRGALYWHFENKSALLSAVHERAKAPIYAAYDKGLEEGKEPMEALRGSVTYSLQALARDERLRNVLAILLFRCERDDQLSNTDVCPAKKRSDTLEKFTDAFQTAYEKGRLIEGMTPDGAAFALHAYIYGIFMDYLRFPEERDLYGKAPLLADIFFRGITR